uniref:Uncharacterized protein n=1 Tax=viral metagenome TaxID=1070528 RepID=A0A6C0I3F2_9ZZZZ
MSSILTFDLPEVEDLPLTDDEKDPSSVLELAANMRKTGDDDDEDEDDDDEDNDVVKDKREDEDEDEDEDDDEEEDEDEEEKGLNDNIGTTHSLLPSIDLSDDDDGDDDDEHYLQKFEDSIHSDIISKHHPELQVHNYEEVDTMTRVVRNENGVIIDPFHKTLPFITKYEKARILGERAKQINSGAKPMISLVDESIIDGYLIALKEYDEKKIPFIIKRPMPNGACEYWRFSDLEVLL